MKDISELIDRVQKGDAQASSELLPLVYDELRRLAQYKIRQFNVDQTLQATALVHEAYVRLVDVENQQSWNSKGHFFSAAAEAMRRIMVDNARRKGRKKRGGDLKRVKFSESQIVEEVAEEDLELLDQALTKFEDQYPDKAMLIKLRFFGGLSEAESAAALDISRATASRYWTFGRTWLFREMKKSES